MFESDVNTRLYAASVSSLKNKELYDAAYNTVSAERRTKTDRFRQEKDKYLSIGAELLLRYSLKDAGIESKDIDLYYGINKKPYLKGNSAYFNISHSGEYVICAVSEKEVGCDIEQITPIDFEIAKRFFFKSEYEAISHKCSQDDKNNLFFRYWTLKESFMKATGLGMKLALDKFEIIIEDDISVIHSVNKSEYSFYEYNGIKDYKCAVCTEGKCVLGKINTIDFEKTELR